MLRSRASRREDPWDSELSELLAGSRDVRLRDERLGLGPAPSPDPADEAELADSVGVALLLVLDSLTPAERLAFVLHDLFGLPFEEIAGIVDRSPAATRQLASRARRSVRSAQVERDADRARQRRVVEAFLAASRAGDFAALLELLDPDVVMRADTAAAAMGAAAWSGALGVAEHLQRRGQCGAARDPRSGRRGRRRATSVRSGRCAASRRSPSPSPWWATTSPASS